ncbi:MAG: hypothetical protein Q7V40_03615 [Pseudolabrys sp.]|nr:hypothetical protein [Pseudolabrys sp.]
MRMDASDNEGLGLSVLVYLGAILGALALLAVPAYWALQPTVYANPPLAQADPLLNSPIIGQRIASRVPLVALKRQSLVDAETTAFLNPKKKAVPAQRVASRPARRVAGTPVADLQTERGRPAIFPFNLF